MTFNADAFFSYLAGVATALWIVWAWARGMFDE